MNARILMFCTTHDEPAWLYSDGSKQCMYNLIVEGSSDNHALRELESGWPTNWLRPSTATQRALAPKAAPTTPINHYPWNDLQGMTMDDSTAIVLHFGLNAICEHLTRIETALLADKEAHR